MPHRFPMLSSDRLPGVVFDDAHNLDLHRDLIDLRSADQSGLAVFQIDFQVGRDNSIAAAGDFSDGRGLLRNDGDDLTFLHAAAGTVNTLAVHKDVAVADHLLGGEDGGRETGAIHHGIQAGFQRDEQLVTRLTGTGFSLGVSDTELLFADGIVVSEFLLFEQQFTIGGELGAAAAILGTMRTGGERTGFPFHGRTVGAAPEAFADTAAELVFRLTCGRHNQSLSGEELL